MPNHVTHRIIATGPAEALNRFKTKCLPITWEKNAAGEQQPFQTFDFKTLIPMPECIEKSESSSVVGYGLAILGRTDVPGPFRMAQSLEDILKYPWVAAEGITDADALREHLKTKFPDSVPLAENAIKAFEETGFTSWYDWSLANWGTKWNAYEFRVVSEERERLEFTFDTAWSTPQPVFQKVAEEFPELTLDICAFDEGWMFSVIGRAENGYLELGRIEADAEIYERVYGKPPQLDDDDHLLRAGGYGIRCISLLPRRAKDVLEMNRYLLAVSPSGHSMVLGLEARTKAECEQVIRWMHVAQFQMDYVITTYNRERDHFVSESGCSYRPGSSPYTAQAWARFQQSLTGRHK